MPERTGPSPIYLCTSFSRQLLHQTHKTSALHLERTNASRSSKSNPTHITRILQITQHARVRVPTKFALQTSPATRTRAIHPKMKVFSNECAFDYSWEEVSTANWRKYCPWNDQSTHVIAVDTLSRHVDAETGIVRPPNYFPHFPADSNTSLASH